MENKKIKIIPGSSGGRYGYLIRFSNIGWKVRARDNSHCPTPPYTGDWFPTTFEFCESFVFIDRRSTGPKFRRVKSMASTRGKVFAGQNRDPKIG